MEYDITITIDGDEDSMQVSISHNLLPKARYEPGACPLKDVPVVVEKVLRDLVEDLPVLQGMSKECRPQVAYLQWIDRQCKAILEEQDRAILEEGT